MTRAAVSFVLTVYNKRRYLADVLASVAAQAGEFEREVIVVDDGSTDGSRELLESLGRQLSGFRLITQPNQGPSVATNRGLAAASMPLVKLLDGDDVLAPDATRHLIDCREFLGVDVVIGAGQPYRPGEMPHWPRSAPSVPRLLPDPLGALLRAIWFTPSNLLIRREALQRSGGCDERVFVQDYTMALRLARSCRFGITDTPIVAAPEWTEIAADRVSANKAQILHDLNLALLLFIEDNPDLPAHYRRTAWRRIAGRSWKWARREVGRPLWSRELALCLGAQFPRGAHERCRQLQHIFTADGQIRRSVTREFTPAIAI
ncbi:MAG: glycosyltransferase family 2 protein [Alphaproteobacteria bacterium]|nr:glycosyltransferase family 2 protein [Alphaproteobacteria bacterium]